MEQGFTIIELLVVIAIIAVLAAVALSNFPQVKLQFSLSRVAYKFDQDVRRSQNLALSAVQYKDSFGNVQPVYGYGVLVDTTNLGNKKYLIYADKNGNQAYDNQDYVVETVDLSASEPGIIIKEIDQISGTSTSINTNEANLATNIANLSVGQTQVSVVFALESNPATTRTISINTVGSVTVN